MLEQRVGLRPPGEFLAEELEARGWTQSDFASIIGRPVQLVSGIVSGKKEITQETAMQIAAGLGTTANYWMNLQNEYQLWRRSQDGAAVANLSRVRRRARLNGYAPVNLLKKRGFVSSDDLDALEQEYLDLLGISSFEERPKILAAARRSNTDEKLTPTQMTWLACARKKASGLSLSSPYDREALRRLAPTLTTTVRTAADWSKIPDLLASVGVRAVYVEAFPGSKVSGFSFLLDDDLDSPVIALSGWGKRFDKVMFTLLHEIAHLVLEHIEPGRYLVDEDETPKNPLETEADDLADQWCLPYEMHPPHTVRRPWLREESQRQGVHPLVIVGRLQHQGVLDWRTELARGGDRVDSHLNAW